MRRRKPDEFSRDDMHVIRVLLRLVPGDSGGHGHREWVRVYLRHLRMYPGREQYRQLLGMRMQ